MAKQRVKNRDETGKRHGASDAITIAGTVLAPGERRRIDIPVGSSFGQSQSLSVVAIHGRLPGPRMFVSAAIHGDEINGVEIIRRLLRTSALRRLRGTLVAIPVVNVYGFTAQSRYLPDRRDLNRAFPGSPKGSLASRLANVFMTEIVQHCTHGIDLHTGALHRSNLPQIRACLEQDETEDLARAFGVPVILHANLRDGSLRQAVLEQEIPVLLYEAGEALRFDEVAIRAGVRGVSSVMRSIGMLPARKKPRSAPPEPMICTKSRWERAPIGGILRPRVKLGDRVHAGQPLAVLSDPLGEEEMTVQASLEGIVIGLTNLPLVNEGDGIFHLAASDESKLAAENVAAFQAELDPDGPLNSDEPPIP